MEPTSSPTSSERSPWSRSAGALAVWLAVSLLLIAVAFAGQSGGGADDEGIPVFFRYDFAIGGAVIYGLLFGIAWIIASVGFGDAPRALGFRRFRPVYVWVALGVTLASFIVSAALEPLFHAGEEQGLAPDEWIDSRWPAFVLNAAVVVLVAPFVEEVFYRGLGVRVLGFLGRAIAIGGTALVFALAHGILVAIPALGVFALGLAWLRWRTESVWPGVIAHAAYNLAGVIGALYFLLD
jgi:membrane protease YdiL (CAAX protease family)